MLINYLIVSRIASMHSGRNLMVLSISWRTGSWRWTSIMLALLRCLELSALHGSVVVRLLEEASQLHVTMFNSTSYTYPSVTTQIKLLLFCLFDLSKSTWRKCFGHWQVFSLSVLIICSDRCFPKKPILLSPNLPKTNLV